MALIIKDETLNSWSKPPSTLVIGGSIRVKKNLLSIPYEISKISEVKAEIIEVFDSGYHSTSELKGKSLKLYFFKGPEYSNEDYIFISEESWGELRDYGVILGDSIISLKIKEVKIDSTWVEIYPKKDVSI